MCSDYLSLGAASRLAPGRPTTNCMWRWCRKGVLARNGQRVKLRHLRLGGKILTSSLWVEEFGKALAEAHAAYFDAAPERASAVVQPRPRIRGRRKGAGCARAGRDLEALNRELDLEGL